MDVKETAEEKPQISVIIIDDDTSVGAILKQVLKDEGFGPIDAFPSGQEGWNAIHKNDYGLIILDWEIPDLSGIALINRIRQHPSYYRVPLMVCSGFLKGKDMSLLDEFLMTGRAEKPIQKPAFMRRVAELLKESSWYNTKEEKLGELLAKLKDDPDKSVPALEKLISESKNQVPLTAAAARVLLRSGHLLQAEKVLKGTLKQNPDSILLLNELGKIKIKQQDYAEAKKILSKAQLHSQENTERLKLLGNANLNMMNFKEAEECFDKALAVDAANKTILKGKKVVENITEYIADLSGTLPTSLASVLNSIGISHVHNSDFTKGLEHYQSALPYVQDPEVQARISFNMGLGYLRWKKPEKALEWLQKSAALSKNFSRSQEIIERIEHKLGKMPAALQELGPLSAESEPIPSEPHEELDNPPILQDQNEPPKKIADPLAADEDHGDEDDFFSIDELDDSI